METFVPESRHERGLSGVELRGQRGAGKLKAVLYTAVLAAAVFAAFRLIPPYVAEYQLSDKMQEVARFGIVNRYTEAQVRDEVFKTVQDLDIPVRKEDIKVSADRASVKIALDYRVPVDLILFQTELHFTPSSENKSLF